MAADLGQSIQLLASKNSMADSLSSAKNNVGFAKQDTETFSSVLDNASKSYKSYADKSENKIDNKYSHKNDKDYSRKTKDISSDDRKHEVKDSSEKTDYQDKKVDNKISDKNRETEKFDKTEDSVRTDKTQSSEKSDITEEAVKTQDGEKTETLEAKDKTENTEEKPVKNIVQELGASAVKVVEELLEKIQNNNIAPAEIAQVLDVAQATEATQVAEVVQTAESQKTETTTQTQAATTQNSTVLNEQILANIEYSNEAELFEKLQTIKNMNPEELKQLIENVKATAQSTVQSAQTIQTQQGIELNPQTLQVATEDIDTQASVKTADVKVETKDVKNTTDLNANTTAVKTAKESLAADTSRLTANVEQTVEEVPQQNLKPITPADTKAEETPRIKVTQEVASQVKENFTARAENKDNTSALKDKAVQTMTALQDKDTTVTQVKYDTNTNNQQQNSNQSASQNMANAQETAMKLNVEQNQVQTNQNGAEVFVNKLDAQLSAMKNNSVQAKTLNQTDIMSQVNAKFEQLQQQGNNKVSIILQPENLGKVSVEIMSSKDGIVAKMTTDNQQVKELFDKNVEALKSSLSSQGVNVNNIKVECTQESANNAMNFEREQFNQSFEGQQNGQNQANQSKQNETNNYSTEYTTASEAEAQTTESTETIGAQTVIEHNGKVDLTV